MTIKLKNKNLIRLTRNHANAWLALSGYILGMISILCISGCRKEIIFEEDLKEPVYFLNGVIGVGELPEFTVGTVVNTTDTFHLNYSCDAMVSFGTDRRKELRRVSYNKGRCRYEDKVDVIDPNTTYTVETNIEGKTLSSTIETITYSPYAIKVTNVQNLGIRINQKFSNGRLQFDTLYRYRFEFQTRYEGNRKPGKHVGFSIELNSDTTWYKSTDILGREHISPRIYQRIDELLSDEKENIKLKVVAEVTIPELMDSLTIFPSIWTVDEPFYEYMQSYEIHEESIGDPFAVPARMYSNIEGGVGIFGSYSRSMDSFRIALPE